MEHQYRARKEIRSMSEARQFSDTSGLGLAIKHAMALDAKPLSRPHLCDALSQRIGVPVSLAMLDAWIAESKTHRLPAAYLVAWCEATQSRRVLDLVVRAMGMELADRGRMELAAIGAAFVERERASARLAEAVQSREGI
jgi:hypothetical protein